MLLCILIVCVFILLNSVSLCGSIKVYFPIHWLKNIWFYWIGQNACMVLFHKTKDTFFIFTNNFIDLDILSMSAISHIVEH